MKIKVKNVLIVFSDNSDIEGAGWGRLEYRDGCEVEVCKHGVEFVYENDYGDYITRTMRDDIEELQEANNNLSAFISEQRETIAALQQELEGIASWGAEIAARTSGGRA